MIRVCRLRLDREQGGERVAGKSSDHPAVFVNAGDHRVEQVAHQGGQGFSAVLAQGHQRGGHRGKSGQVRKQPNSRELTILIPALKLSRNKGWD